MQINGTYNLPIARPQAEPVSTRQPRPRQPMAPAPRDSLPDRPEQGAQYQANRRAPVFLQPANHAVSRTGEQAMRAYHDAAMAGNREELVNRIHELV